MIPTMFFFYSRFGTNDVSPAQIATARSTQRTCVMDLTMISTVEAVMARALDPRAVGLVWELVL